MTDTTNRVFDIQSNASAYLWTVMENENESLGERMEAAIRILAADYQVVDALSFLNSVVNNGEAPTPDRTWAAQKILEYAKIRGY